MKWLCHRGTDIQKTYEKYCKHLTVEIKKENYVNSLLSYQLTFLLVVNSKHYCNSLTLEILRRCLGNLFNHHDFYMFYRLLILYHFVLLLFVFLTCRSYFSECAHPHNNTEGGSFVFATWDCLSCRTHMESHSGHSILVHRRLVWFQNMMLCTAICISVDKQHILKNAGYPAIITTLPRYNLPIYVHTWWLMRYLSPTCQSH